MKKFDTKVQDLKYRIIREVARLSWEGVLDSSLLDIPQKIVPDAEPTMRCCIYKERATVVERIKLAMGGNKENTNVIEVLDIACDECPMGGYSVSNNCRGCLAHPCEGVCPREAISFDKNHTAIIDKTKCVNCGKCANVCPFGAIVNYKRPCERACKVGAINAHDGKKAKIDNEKCIACGACVYQCPWGAIMDKSYVLDAISILKKSESNQKYKVYAVIAPSISGQFVYAKLGQVITGIKELGFYDTIEAALGADMVALEESRELAQKGLLLSSCCPSFVDYVKKQFPNLAIHISHNPSPAAATAIHIKKTDPQAKVIFIGPCTSKKMEFKGGECIDVALTFEELQALFDSKDIDLTGLQETVLEHASYYGRIFARSCGLTDSVVQGLKENGIENFDFKPVACSGIEECRVALLKLSKGVLDANFIEGMACIGGCIGGAGCLTHKESNKKYVDEYGKLALGKMLKDVSKLEEHG